MSSLCSNENKIGFPARLAAISFQGIAEGAMADLPELPDSSKRKFVVQWDTLLDKHSLTGEHLAGYDRERRRLLGIATDQRPLGIDRSHPKAPGNQLDAALAEPKVIGREMGAATMVTPTVSKGAKLYHGRNRGLVNSHRCSAPPLR